MAAQVVVSEHVATRSVDDELVLLNFDSETYYGLDAVGARMLEAVQATGTVGEALAVISQEFEVDERTLRDDLFELVSQLIAEGLVELRRS